MLNMRQEKFVQNLIKGMSQREAYKDAYDAKYKDEAIDSKASVLFNSEKVQIRYNELMEEIKKEITESTIMTATERMIWLSEVVKGIRTEKEAIFTDGDVVVKDVEANLSTKIKALDTLNKMDGQYTTKLEGNIGISYEEALKKVSGKNEY